MCGRETYCLVHFRINARPGEFFQGVLSIIPLPKEFPVPPFVEGQDLTEDTLLHVRLTRANANGVTMGGRPNLTRSLTCAALFLSVS